MFRQLSAKYFEPISMWVIIFGIFSLFVQGFIYFLFAGKFKGIL